MPKLFISVGIRTYEPRIILNNYKFFYDYFMHIYTHKTFYISDCFGGNKNEIKESMVEYFLELKIYFAKLLFVDVRVGL